jgi:hypothetical protein
MHSPKVPHPDFSVQVVRHNLKIFTVEKTSGRSLTRSLDLGRNAQPRKVRRLGQPAAKESTRYASLVVPNTVSEKPVTRTSYACEISRRQFYWELCNDL